MVTAINVETVEGDQEMLTRVKHMHTVLTSDPTESPINTPTYKSKCGRTIHK
jgi:hypothetical protein